jgi:hypothetical protein
MAVLTPSDAEFLKSLASTIDMVDTNLQNGTHVRRQVEAIFARHAGFAGVVRRLQMIANGEKVVRRQEDQEKLVPESRKSVHTSERQPN